MIKIDLISKEEDFKNLGKEWNDLLDKSESNSIFLTWEWLFNWWCFYKNNYEKLFILLAKEDGKLIGIAPLMLKKYSFFKIFNFSQLEFLGIGEICSDHLDFIILEGREEETIKEIFNFLLSREFGFLSLSDIPEDSKNLEYFENFSKENKMIFRKNEIAICPFIPFIKSIEDYKKNLGKSAKREIPRYFRRLNENFKVKFEFVDNKEKLQKAFYEVTKLNKKKSQKKNLKNNFVGRMLSFHKRVSEIFLEKGFLDFSLLFLNDRVVSYCYNFIYNKKMFAYSTSFDPTYPDPKYRVGLILINHCIENNISKGVQEFNLGRGDHSYKYKFTKEKRKNFSIKIGKRNLKNFFFITIFDLAMILKKILFYLLPKKLKEKLKEKIFNSNFIAFR